MISCFCQGKRVARFILYTGVPRRQAVRMRLIKYPIANRHLISAQTIHKGIFFGYTDITVAKKMFPLAQMASPLFTLIWSINNNINIYVNFLVKTKLILPFWCSIFWSCIFAWRSIILFRSWRF